MTTTLLDYHQRLLASAAFVASLGDLGEDAKTIASSDHDTSCGGTVRTASMSEILAHNHDSDASQNDTRQDFPKENSFVVLNSSYSSNTFKDEETALLRARENELRNELRLIEEQIHEVYMERETFELEKEIVVEEAKAKLANLQKEATKQRERLRKAHEHLEKVKQNQQKIRHQKQVLVNEMETLVEISEGLMREARFIELKTKEVEMTVQEYGKRLGVDEKESHVKEDAESRSNDILSGIQIVRRRSLLKALQARTRQVLPKKHLFGSRTSHMGPKFGSIEHQKEEAEKEQEYLLRQLEQANTELMLLEGHDFEEDQEHLMSSSQEGPIGSLIEDDSILSG